MENSKTKISNILEKASLFKILSEPKRLMLLDKIMEGVQCNCELGYALDMAPNLISHHISILREAGLVNARRDSTDARWIYYSINIEKLEQLRSFFNEYFNPKRIKPRLPSCGPSFDNEPLVERSTENC